MKFHFTAIENDGFYVGSLKEYPGVITQGKSVDELKENLLDALQLYLESKKDETTVKQPKQLVRL